MAVPADRVYTLIGDLGGTNCRVRLMEISYSTSYEKILFEQRYLSRDWPNLQSILVKFLQTYEVTPQSPQYPHMVVICVAGPVSSVQRAVVLPDGTSRVIYGTGAFSTNLQWAMESFAIADSLSLPSEHVTLINDFEAVGYGCLGLTADQYVQIGGDTPRPEAPIGVIGPGTGLGEAYLTGDKRGAPYTVHGSEGGHSTYGPVTMEEFKLVQYIQEEYNVTHVSWERVCSGTGIRSVYRYFKSLEEPNNPLYFAKNINVYDTAKPKPEDDAVLAAQHPSQMIFDNAKKGDPLCTRAVNLFISGLGRETGNLAAKLLPYGGIYIAGGVAAKIRWALDPNISTPTTQVDPKVFVKTISDKGRLKPFIESIPIYLVLIDEVGLLGCIVVAKRIGKINTNTIPTEAKL